MYEVMRWISLGLSLFALCFSSYGMWFSFHVNEKLRRRNMDLTMENVKLRKKIADYEAELLRLRNLLMNKENNNDY